MNRLIASRVASRRILSDVVAVFFDALRWGAPTARRAFIELIPPAIDTFTLGAAETIAWRINASLHMPTTVGRVAVRVMAAARSDGALRKVVEKVVAGDQVERRDVDALVDVLEGATVDVLNDITDVRSAAEAMRMPVDDAIRLTLRPRVSAARNAVQAALGN
jgi:hypothetical protein